MTKKMKWTGHKLEGLKVVDANEDVAIVINRSDVKNSNKKDPNSCAAALAGRREFKTDVRVFMTRMYVKDKRNKVWVRFMNPESISREITAFDRGADFEPGEYTFKAPSESERLGQYKKGGSRPHTGKGRKPIHRTGNVRISAKERMSSK